MKFNIFFLLIISQFLACKKERLQIKKIEGKQIEIGQNYESDFNFTQFILPYKIQIQEEINKVLCYNPTILTKEENQLESSLGNFYADICFEKSNIFFYKKTRQNIDFALFNYGGIRTIIPKGNIIVKNIFELLPFENVLVITELTGEQTLELFKYLEKNRQANPISNLKIELKNKKLNSILIQGQSFDISKHYFVLTHDYLQHGGDNMDFFKNPISLFNTKLKVRDVLIDYLFSIDTLNTKIDGRFVELNSKKALLKN